jgi:hypothetical protein
MTAPINPKGLPPDAVRYHPTAAPPKALNHEDACLGARPMPAVIY